MEAAPEFTGALLVPALEVPLVPLAPPGPGVPAEVPVEPPDEPPPYPGDDPELALVALAWKAAKVLLALGLMAKTIPEAEQCGARAQ